MYEDLSSLEFRNQIAELNLQFENFRKQQLLFNVALNNISELIVTNTNFDYTIETINKIVGETLGVDTVSFYSIFIQEKFSICNHSWSKFSNDNMNQFENNNAIDLLTSYFLEIVHYQYHIESHVSAINQCFTSGNRIENIHEVFGIKSLLWFPFGFEEGRFHVLTFHQTNVERNWKKEEIGFVASVSNQLNMAIMKKKLLNENKQLIESETKSKILINNLPCAAMIVQKDTKTILARNSYARDLGVELGKFCFQIWNNCNQTCEFCELSNAYENENATDKEVFSKGNYYHCYWIPLNDKEYVHYIFDITERKNGEILLKLREAELAKQTKLFETLLDNLQVGVFMVEAPSGKPLLANKTAKYLLGRGILETSKNDLAEVCQAYKIGTNEHYPLDEMPIVLGMYGESRHINDMAIRRPDGVETLLEVFGTPIKDVNGNIWASLVSFFDITERTKTEQILKDQNEEILSQNEEIKARNEEYEQTNEELIIVNEQYYLAKEKAEENELILNLILEHSPVYIYIKNENSQVFKLSKNFKNLLNIPINEIIRKTNHELWNPEYSTKMDEDDLQIIENNIILNIEEEIEGKIYNTIKFPIQMDNKPRYLVGFSLDITERKNAELVISKQNNELIKLNNDKDRFISILAHDLKSPFNSLLGFSDLLANNVRKYDIDKIEKQVNIINEATKRTFALLEDILLWVRSQSGKLRFVPDKLNVHSVCNNVIDKMHLVANVKRITINNLSTNDVFIHADINMFKTILLNLITNAIKFTRYDGKIEIKTEIHQSFVQISVSDNGVGINDLIKKKLFDITMKVSTEGTEKEGGTGLGLLLCKEFVEKHNCKIWVESEAYKGSVFTFTMPLYVNN